VKTVILRQSNENIRSRLCMVYDGIDVLFLVNYSCDL